MCISDEVEGRGAGGGVCGVSMGALMDSNTNTNTNANAFTNTNANTFMVSAHNDDY